MSALRYNLSCTVIALAVGFSLSACNWFGSQGAKTGAEVLSGVDVVCHALENSFDVPDNVRVACQYVDKVDGVSKVFFAKVPQKDAVKMGVRAPCVGAASSVK